jgi:hypothetical protein
LVIARNLLQEREIGVLLPIEKKAIDSSESFQIMAFAAAV